MDKSHYVIEIYKRLHNLYPNAVTFLDYKSPYQLMVAVILSAQTTDAQVNKVTSKLFLHYPKPEDLRSAQVPEVEKIIRSTGFYKVKARNIMGAAEKVTVNFNSRVPECMEDLLTLPGVGRKSANVIRAHCFNKPAIIVDTHFSRVVKRLELTSSSNPVIIESDLLKITDRTIQSDFSMVVNIHGRKCCTARSPSCKSCILKSLCRYSN